MEANSQFLQIRKFEEPEFWYFITKKHLENFFIELVKPVYRFNCKFTSLIGGDNNCNYCSGKELTNRQSGAA